MAFLIGSRPDVTVECIPSCHSPDNPPKYPPMNFNEHMAAIKKKNYDLPEKKEQAAE
ncbi:MAG: hypothetical protein O3A84_07515 [Proteobacteria bacterium]|nr:hypothetical protein [Pseudomonadota bacterium]